MTENRKRADRLLVSKGFFESRTAARMAIEAGGVTANGAAVTKASQMLAPDAEIVAEAAHGFVSRGGLKLDHALKMFNISPDGRTCLDLGASTGGFTDVLLQGGARHVTAIDVGRGQLHARLQGDPRVSGFESTDARALTAVHMCADVSLIAVDVSFIALEKALPVVLELAAPGTDFVGLFKPQFQVGRAHIGRGGLVRDEAATERAISAFNVFMENMGWPILAWTTSPLRGGDGNAEHLFHARKSGGGTASGGSTHRPD